MSRKLYLYIAWAIWAIASLFALTTADVFRYTIFSLIPLLSILSIEYFKRGFRHAVLLILVWLTVPFLAPGMNTLSGLGFKSSTFLSKLAPFGQFFTIWPM